MQFISTLIIGLLLVVLLAAALAFPTMWLWNYLMPVVFGLTTITFKQALAMNLLASLLFGRSTSTKSSD